MERNNIKSRTWTSLSVSYNGWIKPRKQTIKFRPNFSTHENEGGDQQHGGRPYRGESVTCWETQQWVTWQRQCHATWAQCEGLSQSTQLPQDTKLSSVTPIPTEPVSPSRAPVPGVIDESCRVVALTEWIHPGRFNPRSGHTLG